MSVLELARGEILAMQPYSSARMESSSHGVMLNANESPWPFPAAVGLNRYPEPQPMALRSRLAALYGVEPDQVLASRGSDESIDLLVRAFCRPLQDAVMICPPTFGMYAVSAEVQGAKILRVPLSGPDFTLDVDRVLAAVTPAVKLLFVCSPNNPTGGLVPLASVRHLASALAGRALVIVDEAYVEFAGAQSTATLLQQHDNLGVLRTLSKAWGLAGARIGALLAHAEVVDLLRRIMPPYPLPTPSVDAAMAVLGGGEGLMRKHVAVVATERESLRAALETMPGVREVLPSRANFLAVRFEHAVAIQRSLVRKGIVVRDVTRYPGLEDALRISIGTPAENNRLLEVLYPLVRGQCEEVIPEVPASGLGPWRGRS